MQTDVVAHRSKLLQMLTGFQLAQVIAVGARLGVSDLLKDGAKSSDELAQMTRTHSQSLYRLLRALAAAGLLSERPGRVFALTPLGDLLRSDVSGSVNAMATFVSTKGFWRRWGELLERVRTGPHSSDAHFTERWQEDPEAAAFFNRWMTEGSTSRAAVVLKGYDFAGIKTIVDIGGGHGRLIALILKAYPTMRGILFDLPHVIEGAQSVLAEAGVADRCQLIAGSFFESVPKGGDAYLLSVVIHDWDDERALTILRNCRAGMGPSSRLLLIERVVPTDGPKPLDTMLADLNMLVGPGGGERTEAEFASLLSAARLSLRRIVPLELSFKWSKG